MQMKSQRNLICSLRIIGDPLEFMQEFVGDRNSSMPTTQEEKKK